MTLDNDAWAKRPGAFSSSGVERKIEKLERKLAEVSAENERLRADLDRITKGSWSKELARLSQANAEARAEIERLREPGPVRLVAEGGLWKRIFVGDVELKNIKSMKVNLVPGEPITVEVVLFPDQLG
jgi:cell division protein FtsB